jgi:ubiquinol-cytochrome c reductase iron-sulfur subunit
MVVKRYQRANPPRPRVVAEPYLQFLPTSALLAAGPINRVSMATLDNPSHDAPLAGEAGPDDAPVDDGVRRRDVINIAALSFAGIGAVAAIAPMVYQMAPSADVLAMASVEVDISKILSGQAIKTSWRKQPVFVRNLTAKEIAEANAVDISTLRDPQTLAERTKPGHANWLITLGVCTHLGCIPLGTGEGENKGPFGGYFCPCHGSAYDTAARIRKGPAPKNLMVPDYSFSSPTVVKIG